MSVARLGRASASAWGGGRCRRRDDRLGSDVFGHELGVLAQAIAGALDLHDHGMVKQPVQQGHGNDRLAEHREMPLLSIG